MLDQVQPLEYETGLNGIRTNDPCDAGAVLYQLSYESHSVESKSVSWAR